MADTKKTIEKEARIMKKKIIAGGIVVAFLCLIGYTGTRYAK